MGPDLSDSGGRLGFPLLCQLLNRYVGYREIFPRLRRRAGTYLPMIGVGGGKKHGPSQAEKLLRLADERRRVSPRLQRWSRGVGTVGVRSSAATSGKYS